ncbi:hypothetical protein PRUPE_1G087400 [Prunus persica]|uniref:Uncharacterized protein n=1 Tax=Prunus persica TaxID=3760 RepID=M5Y783_PRUPE|nr:hypothetical protein PRUPE_1G087400 [Prunus persica]
METLDRAPFGEVTAIEESKPYGKKLYDVEVDYWRNMSSDSCKEPYKTLPGHVFLLSDAKPESISDIQESKKSWAFLIVTEVSNLSFKVKASKELQVSNGIQASLFMAFLINITPNVRIWKAIDNNKSARWKVLFSDNFLKSFKKLKSFRLKMSLLFLLLKLSSGWRPNKRNVEKICESSLMIWKKFKVEGIYIVCTTEIEKDWRYMQVLKIWDILPDLDLEIPASWPPSLDVARFEDLSIAEKTPSYLLGDSSADRSYVEKSNVSESLLLMKFYSLSSGVANFLLSNSEGRELDLPFQLTDQEMEIVRYNRSTFILGRSGTGKTTVLTMKLCQKEQQQRIAEEGFYGVENALSHVFPNNNEVEQSPTGAKMCVLRQLFVTVSAKLCFAVKQHVLHLKSFSSGGNHSGECNSTDSIDFEDEEAQFNNIPDSFLDIPPNCYPLFITFHKFLMMLDGTLGNSFFERFLDTSEPQPSSRSVALQTVLRQKEVNLARFSTSYWPHFNIRLTKKLDPSKVFTEIISHIKGGLGVTKAGDGKLSRGDYVQRSEGRVSNLSKEKREMIYDIFLVYEKKKKKNVEFDVTDFVNDIHRRLRREKYKGHEMDFVYIDEVQDLTVNQIRLFKHVCSNVEEGFVFSGDTAQAIARGIDFRFQDIRHMFYKEFVLESKRDKHEQIEDKGQLSKIFHLSQNFRTHDGILKLSQSIIDLLYHFFPQSIDKLKPETSPIYGEAPVLLEPGKNENIIKKIFGSFRGNIVGFGAEQVILVRDERARNEIFNQVAKRALVLTILESKGLEFQDVLLYNFFGSSPLQNQWRVIYDYMKEHDLLDSTLPEHFPSFDEDKHNILCSELKQLYVAVSRTKQRLWVYENMEELSNPMFNYWKRKCLVQVRHFDDSLAREMQAQSNPEEWRSRGMKLYQEDNYEMATMCFQRAGDTYWERRSKAAGLKVMADLKRTSNPGKANALLKEAGEIFESLGKADSAAQCFFDSGEYKRAANIYLEKCGERGLERAGKCFSLAGFYEHAADAYARGKFFSECLTMCLKGKLFDIGLEYFKFWKQQAREEYDRALRRKGTDEIELDFLENCAFHYYHEVEDNRSKMKLVKGEMLSGRKFLNTHLSSSSSKYVWEENIICDPKKYSEVKKSKKQVSIDSLVYFWNFWMDKIVYLIEYFGCLETLDVNKRRSYGDFFLNYLAVWREFHDDLNPIYLLLISDADWVSGVDKRYFISNGELVTVDFCQIVSSAKIYWSSELLSFSTKILNKLQVLYEFMTEKSDSIFCQSWCLTQIYVVANCLLESKYLKLTYTDLNTLQNFVNLSTENIVACIFPLDWRKSLRENMISLRQNDACKSLLKKVVVDYMNSKKKLSYGQVGRIAMIILGSSNFNNELYAVNNLHCSAPWKVFIKNICQEPKEESLPWWFHEALDDTYLANWEGERDYLSPDCLLYLFERLLMWVSCLQGYVITTKSCFTKWLIHQQEDTKFTSSIRPDVPICSEVILQFLIDVVQDLLYDKDTVVEWIQKSIKDWEKYYSLLILRLVVILCLLYFNFGMCFSILLELIWRDYITEQLPKEFCEALRRLIFVQNSPSINVNLIEEAFKKIGNPLVVASFGIDCSRFICSDAIFFDMKANLCIDEMLRTLFSKQHIHVQSSRGQSEAMVVEAKSYCSAAPSAYDSNEANCSKLVPNAPGLVTDKVQNTGNSKQSSLPLDFDFFWEIIEGLQLLDKEGDQRSFSSEASTIKLDLERAIGTWTAAWYTYYSNCDDRGALSAEVLHMLDETVQLYAVLDGSEQELRNKISTVAELSRRLQSRRQTLEPILTRLVLEHNSRLAVDV